MIVIRLQGGLGNQMFQYAFGLYLAERQNQELYFDDASYSLDPLRELELIRYRVAARRMSPKVSHRIPARYRNKSRLQEKAEAVFGLLLGPKRSPLKLLREKPFGFQDRWLAKDKDIDVYLDGYWQSERFFPGMRSTLQRHFQLRKPVSQESAALAKQMQTTESVAVHVRRTDYQTNPGSKKIYRALDSDYYRKCCTDLQRSIAKPTLFLFSDDIDWCLENLDVGLPFVPVTHNDASTAHEDMYLISRCRHAVIANSSFSWWGAYLGEERTDRRVYYPSPWFNPGTLDGSALGCEGWIAEHTLLGQEQRLAG